MIGLFFGGNSLRTSFGNTFGNIELDAVLDENHEWSAEATSNPVEVGAPVTDHVIEQSDKLRIRGFVTDSSISLSMSIMGLLNLGDVGNRTQGVFDLLHQLIKLKEPITVYTKHRIYDDMVLTNVTIPRSASVGEAIEFTADFVHIRKVATQMVDVPDGVSAKKDAKAGGANGSIAKKSEPTKNIGKKQVETVQRPAGASASASSKGRVKPSSTLSRLLI